MKKTLLYAQSGGVTAVINATAAAVIRAAREDARIGQVLAARNGILGALDEDLIDTAVLSPEALVQLAHTPGGAFGSCRFDLDDPARNPAQYDRLFDVFAAHQVGFFLYNGGNGSMDVITRLSAEARRRAYPLVCVGVPKTIDNDLMHTDFSPGFGSAAKYVATSMLEAGLDLQAMASRVGRAFVLEVMGRNAGWVAAATALAGREDREPPHLVLMPEVLLDEQALLQRVEAIVSRHGFCAITVSEGIRNLKGEAVMEQSRDSKGHVQLGGAGQCITRMITRHFGFKSHWAIPDYLQRSAGHLVSATDHTLAGAVGQAAVRFALDGLDGMMVSIRRLSDRPYRWQLEPVPCASVGNLERTLPAEFIREDGFHVTDRARAFLQPLVEGEVPPPFSGGLPTYLRLSFTSLPRRLPVLQTD